MSERLTVILWRFKEEYGIDIEIMHQPMSTVELSWLDALNESIQEWMHCNKNVEEEVLTLTLERHNDFGSSEDYWVVTEVYECLPVEIDKFGNLTRTHQATTNPKEDSNKLVHPDTQE